MAVPERGISEYSDSNVRNVSTSDERYRDIALKCLGELQARHERNLVSGGYDPGGARVSTDDWIKECARAGISRSRLDAIRSLILRAVTIENGYIRRQ